MVPKWVKMVKTVIFHNLVNFHQQCAIKAGFLLNNSESLDQTEDSATSAANCTPILHGLNEHKWSQNGPKWPKH